MLYHYYMKINSLRWFSFIFLFFFPCLITAQVTVVRVQDTTVYLDTSSLNRTVQKGEAFKIILSSEMLTNPKTGKELGLIYHYTPVGIIHEVQPLYAVGALPPGTKVSVGQEAVLEEISTTPAAIQKAQTVAAEENSTRKKITFAPVEQTIISLSEGPILSADAADIITLSDKGLVTVWTRQGETLHEKGAYQLPAFRTPISISAVPLSSPETADVFVAYYDTRQERILTSVLHYQDKQFSEIDTLPYFIKERGCNHKKTAWAQRAFVSGIYPGNARELTYQDGKFSISNDRFATQHNWLTATDWASLENEEKENLIYLSTNGRIIAQLANGKRAESKSLFAATPTRIKYKNEIVKFYPSLQVFGVGKKAVIVGVENTAKLGLLSSTFGQYQNGKINFMTLEKGRLKVTDSVEMDGVVYDTACTQNTLLTAEVLPDATSSVVEIFN